VLGKTARQSGKQCSIGFQLVAVIVVARLLNKQIGGELGTSEATVKIHRHQVMKKMEAGSLPELVRMADRLGILSPKS
jgi:FixJ family two-component response regulator